MKFILEDINPSDFDLAQRAAKYALTEMQSSEAVFVAPARVGELGQHKLHIRKNKNSVSIRITK